MSILIDILSKKKLYSFVGIFHHTLTIARNPVARKIVTRKILHITQNVTQFFKLYLNLYALINCLNHLLYIWFMEMAQGSDFITNILLITILKFCINYQ